MSDVRVLHPRGREPEREYVLDVVLRELLGLEVEVHGADVDDVRIAAGDDGRWLHVPDVLLAVPATAWLSGSALPREPLRRLPPEGPLVEPLPVLYGAGPLVAEADDGLALGVDVFGGSFYLLTRYEEAVRRVSRDRHDRFPFAASLEHRERLVRRPLVDEYAELLGWALGRLWPGLRPRRREPRVLVSHDVDFPLYRPRSARELVTDVRRDVLLHRDPALAARRVSSAVRAARGRLDGNVYDTFGFLLDEAERLGLHSTWYVLAADAPYRLDEPWIARLLRRIVERGHELGLHASYGAHLDAGRIRAELEAVAAARDAAGAGGGGLGSRQHFLRWRNPETWRALDEAGLVHDSTLGFAERAGFRCGTCREFPVFDLERRRRLRLRERPLVAMEVSLLAREYEGLDASATVQVVRGLAATCRRHGGDLTLLWHNNRVASARDRRLYRDVLDAALA